MTYCLIQLAPDAYDLLLSDEVMGSIVRIGQRSKSTSWTAELLDDLPKDQRPAPSAKSSTISRHWKHCANGSAIQR
jgi:hypothetical protein